MKIFRQNIPKFQCLETILYGIWTFFPIKSGRVAFIILRKLILQTRMCSHPVGLHVWILVGPFVYFHTSCVRTAKALARLRGCAGSPEPSLVAYVISTIISWAGSKEQLTYICKHRRITFYNLVNTYSRAEKLQTSDYSECFSYLGEVGRGRYPDRVQII